jgi:hypothetical protein
MEKTIELGKIDYEETGKRLNLVDCQFGMGSANGLNWETLKPMENAVTFTASAGIWNRRHTDYLTCGQILDEVFTLVSDPVFTSVYRIWKEYHLNDLQAGTRDQTRIVKAYTQNHKYDYEGVCEVLIRVGLYEDRGYVYGSKWLIKPIPYSVQEEIEYLLKA